MWLRVYVLIGLFVFLMFRQSWQDIAPFEASTLYTTRDIVQVETASPGDMLRAARVNLDSAFSRASETGLTLPYALAVDGWSWLAGESVVGLRYGFALLVMLSAALMARVSRRWDRTRDATVMPVLLLSMIVLLRLAGLSYIRWPVTLDEYLAVRAPDEPALTAFAPGSIGDYYDAAYGLRQGMGINLGWREFSGAEVAAVLENLDDSRPIWLLVPESWPHTQQVNDTLISRGFDPEPRRAPHKSVYIRYWHE
jgi:hypothetical protein